MNLVNSPTCQLPGCNRVRHTFGPFCKLHGCRICGMRITKEWEGMQAPLCFECAEAAKAQPRMKKHPTRNIFFHESISVEAGRLPSAQLQREVLPGLVRGDGERMSVMEFRQMCADARAKGMLVLPPCETYNTDGTCKGHAPPTQLDDVLADTRH